MIARCLVGVGAVHVVHGLNMRLARPGCHAVVCSVERGEGVGGVWKERGGVVGRPRLQARHLPPEQEVSAVVGGVGGRVVGVEAAVLLAAVSGLRQLQAGHVARLHEGVHGGHTAAAQSGEAHSKIDGHTREGQAEKCWHIWHKPSPSEPVPAIRAAACFLSVLSPGRSSLHISPRLHTTVQHNVTSLVISQN